MPKRRSSKNDRSPQLTNLRRWLSDRVDDYAAAIDETEAIAVLRTIATRTQAELARLLPDNPSAQRERPTAPGVPERCPACLSPESAAVRVIESRIAGFGALIHDAPPKTLGSAARACVNCGAIYFPRLKEG